MAITDRPVPQKGQIWIYRPQENPEPGSTLTLSHPESRYPVGLEDIRYLFENRPLEPLRYLFAFILGDFKPSGGREAPDWLACLLIDGGLRHVTPPTSPATTPPPTPYGSGNMPPRIGSSRRRQNSDPLRDTIPRNLALEDPYFSRTPRQDGDVPVVYFRAVHREHLLPLSNYVPGADMVMARDSTMMHEWLDNIGRDNEYRTYMASSGFLIYLWENWGRRAV